MEYRKRYQSLKKKETVTTVDKKLENIYKEASEREFLPNQSFISITDQTLVHEASVSHVKYVDAGKNKNLDKYRTIKLEKDSGGIDDLHMGPTEQGEICLTCHGDSKSCIGHFGDIELSDYFYHPAYLKDISLILNSVCSTCGSLLLTEDTIKDRKLTGKLANIAQDTLKVTGADKKYEYFPHEIKTSYKGKCSGQKYFDSKNLTSSTADTICYFSTDGAGKQIPFTAREASVVLSYITVGDAKLLGFVGTHPKNFIIKYLPVIPPIARFPATVDGKTKDHPLTVTYLSIMKSNYKLGAAKTENARKEGYAEVVKELKELMTKAPGNESSDKIVSVRTTIQSKNGLIRGASMGKRANYTGRTVLGPGPTLRMGQVRIPKSMAKNLTVKEIVNETNIDYLQSLLSPDDPNEPIRISYISKGRGKYEGRTTVALRYRQLEYGDIVERWLQNGDYVIFNRQPTLHKYGMMGHEVVLGDEETIGLRLEEAKAYNFDFDGDEGNIHAFQSWKAIFEAMSIAYVRNNIINGQIAVPLVAATYDTLVASFLMTRPDTILTKEDKVEYLSTLVYRDQLATLDARLKKYKINPYSGRALFSALLPVGFNYENDGVVITDGVLIDGVISKKHIGNSDNTIIQTMWKDDFLGPERAANFISDLAFLTNAWYKTQGFTVSLSDLEPMNFALKESVLLEYEKAKFMADSLGAPPSDPMELERWETNIVSIVNSFKSVGSSIMKQLPDSNAFKIMAESGSKGDASNVAQMNGGLGQTMFMGKRLKYAITHNSRIMPHYEENSLDLDARGFIPSNFMEGLTAPELFMHFMWAREGILDTALKTGDTGYIHHRIVKNLEDNVVKYDGSVRNAAGRIIEFHYAEDCFSGNEIQSLNTSRGKMNTFYNFKQQNKKMNRLFGF